MTEAPPNSSVDAKAMLETHRDRKDSFFGFWEHDTEDDSSSVQAPIVVGCLIAPSSEDRVGAVALVGIPAMENPSTVPAHKNERTTRLATETKFEILFMMLYRGKFGWIVVTSNKQHQQQEAKWSPVAERSHIEKSDVSLVTNCPFPNRLTISI